MNRTEDQTICNRNYVAPRIDIIQIYCADIMSTSGVGDGNQGEWDPQLIDD